MFEQFGSPSPTLNVRRSVRLELASTLHPVRIPVGWHPCSGTVHPPCPWERVDEGPEDRAPVRKTSLAQPVVEATAPEQVRSIMQVQTSDSRGVFVTRWIEVSTDSVFVCANDHRSQPFDDLQRRCPQAKLQR